jgi:hypothetical protein
VVIVIISCRKTEHKGNGVYQFDNPMYVNNNNNIEDDNNLNNKDIPDVKEDNSNKSNNINNYGVYYADYPQSVESYLEILGNNKKTTDL